MKLGDYLESIAEAAGDATPALSVTDVATISIAVSLKRIADELCGGPITINQVRARMGLPALPENHDGVA